MKRVYFSVSFKPICMRVTFGDLGHLK